MVRRSGVAHVVLCGDGKQISQWQRRCSNEQGVPRCLLSRASGGFGDPCGLPCRQENGEQQLPTAPSLSLPPYRQCAYPVASRITGVPAVLSMVVRVCFVRVDALNVFPSSNPRMDGPSGRVAEPAGRQCRRPCLLRSIRVSAYVRLQRDMNKQPERTQG